MIIQSLTKFVKHNFSIETKIYVESILKIFIDVFYLNLQLQKINVLLKYIFLNVFTLVLV